MLHGLHGFQSGAFPMRLERWAGQLNLAKEGTGLHLALWPLYLVLEPKHLWKLSTLPRLSADLLAAHEAACGPGGPLRCAMVACRKVAGLVPGAPPGPLGGLSDSL